MAERDWYWYVLGLVTEELIYQASGGVVTDPCETAHAHATTIGHALMVRATDRDVAARLVVAPIVKRACSMYNGSAVLRQQLDTATHRPIRVAAGLLIGRNSRAYTIEPVAAQAALCYWDLKHPVCDMVRAALPLTPPDTSTKDKAYTFFGGIINNATISERAARLSAAASGLLGDA